MHEEGLFLQKNIIVVLFIGVLMAMQLNYLQVFQL